MEDSVKNLEVAEPNNEVAEETTEVGETPQETAEVDYIDSDSGEKETVDETDSSENAQSENEDDKQTSDKNAEFAKIRRKAENDAKLKTQEEIEKAKAEAFKEGRLASYKGRINPYTNKPITDYSDLEMYEAMFKLEEEGKDPLVDLPEYLAAKQREEVKIAKERQELETKVQEELNEFMEKYPSVNVEELLKDKFFMDYIEGKDKSLTILYENFNNFKNSFRNSAVEVAKQTIANAKATPGSLSGDSEVEVDYGNMSNEEFERMIQRAKDGELR